MKNYKLITFITITLLLCSCIVFGQDTTKVTTSTIYNDVKHAVSVNGPKISQAVQSIAKDLKVTADQIWNILVKQQKVWSWCILLGELFTIFSWFHFWYRLGKLRDAVGYNYPDSLIVAVVITGILALCGTVVSAIYFSQMMTGFINPEYGAMKTIAEIAQTVQ